jgi:predicted DNA-binding WGR domain protein
MFPMTIKKWSGRAESSSGGKDYHVVLVMNRDNHAIVITRWGKKDQWGNGWEVKRFHSHVEAVDLFCQKQRAKQKRGYNYILIDTTRAIADEKELRERLGAQYWSELGADNLHHLDPSLDASDSREKPPTEYVTDEYGNIHVKQRAPKLAPPPELPKKSHEQEVAEHVAANSDWGLF